MEKNILIFFKKFNKIKILVLTNFHRRFLEKLGVDKGKIVTLPNYLDLSKQKKPLGNESFYYMLEE